jgi:two-component system response regulator HydG
MLIGLGHDIEEAHHNIESVRLIERGEVDLFLAGVEPDDSDALELLTQVRGEDREVPVILLFSRADPDRANEALRKGAVTVLKYPFPAVILRAAVTQALEDSGCRRARDRIGSDLNRPSPSPEGSRPPASPPPDSAGLRVVSGLNQQLREDPGLPVEQETPTSHQGPTNGPTPATLQRLERAVREIGLIGEDPSWLHVIDVARILAASRTPLLIVGEPGTGKSLVARLIHSLGDHPERPFVTFDASETTNEVARWAATESSGRAPAPVAPDWSELDRAGGGTLFIDEVCGLSTELQLPLLQELHPVEFGSTPQAARCDVRYVMSSCENLTELIKRGLLCVELYHRISLLTLMLPPLRHRGADIELLAESFRASYSREFRVPVRGFARDALDVLHRYHWPGNVRALAAAVRRAVALCSSPLISSIHLVPIINQLRRVGDQEGTPRPQTEIRPLAEALEEPEKRILVEALQAFDWSRQKAAQALDINRTTLYKKMQKYHLMGK